MINIFKKKKVENEKIDNEFDLDSDLDLGDFSFDSEPPPDDRSPVTKFASGFFSGVKDTATNPETITKIGLEVLPDQYRQVYDLGGSVVSSVKQSYEDANNQLRPVVKDIKRLTTKLIPQESKFIPKRVLDKVQEWREEAQDKVISAQDQQNATIANVLADVFKEQYQQSQQQQAEDKATDQIEGAIDKQRFENNFAIFNQINKHVSNLDSFQSGIGLNFQKKSLELQLRSLFSTQTATETGVKTLALLNTALPAIAKNTALPDFQKINKVEILKEISQKKFAGALGAALFGDSTKFIQDTIGGFSKRVNEKVAATASAVSGAVNQVAMPVEMASGMGGGLDKTEMAGDIAGSFVSQTALSQYLKSKKEKINDNSKVKEGASRLENFLVKLPGMITDFKKNAEYSGTYWKEQLADFIPSQGIDTGLKKNNLEDLDKPQLFTKQTNLAVTDIIPGYLSRILREIQVFRTGDEKIGLTVFDPATGTFMDRKASFKKLLDRVVTESDIDYNKYKTDKITEAIDPENKLSAKTKDMIKARMIAASGAKQSLTKENFSDTTRYGTGDDAKAAAKAVTDYIEKVTQDREKETEAYKLYNHLATTINDPRGNIELIKNLGYTEELKQAGLINYDSQGNSAVNMNNYMKLVSSKDEYQQMLDKFKESDKSQLVQKPVASFGNIPTTTVSKSDNSKIESTLVSSLNKKLDELITAVKSTKNKPVSIGSIEDTKETKDWRDKLYTLLESHLKVTETSKEHLGKIELAVGHLQAIETGLNKLDSMMKGFSTGARNIYMSAKDKASQGLDKAKEIYHGEGFKGFMSRAAYGLGGITEKAVKLSKLGFTKTKRQVTKGARGIKGLFFKGKDKLNHFDIYYKDEQLPRIYWEKLQKGHYTDKMTKKVIKKLEDIKGDVIDDNGEVVIASTEVQYLTVKYQNDTIPFLKKVKKSALDFGLKALKAIPGGMGDVVATTNRFLQRAWDTTRAIGRKAFELFDAPFDVHIPGEKNNPVMLATVWRNGGYFSKKTGNIIKTPSDIDGEVVDDKGNIVLSLEMIKKGMYNAAGKLYKAPIAKILAGIGKVKDAGISAFILASKMAKKGVQALGGIASESFKFLKNFFATETGPATEVLKEIRDILLDRLPDSTGKKGIYKKKMTDLKDKKLLDVLTDIKSKFTKPKGVLGDKDDDGIRDNSWLEMKAKRVKEAKDKFLANRAQKKEQTKPGESSSLLEKLASVAGLVFSGMKGALGLVGKFGKIFTKFGPLFRTLGGAAKLLGKGGLLLGSLGVKGAIAAGGATLSGLGSVAVGAASAALGLLSSPVVLGAAAVGLAGYGAYKLYKSFSAEGMNPINKLRYIQYGYAEDDKDNASKILSLEEYMLQNVGDSDKGPDINAAGVKLDKVMDILGLDYQKESDIQLFVTWFKARFKPVFLTHLAAIKAIRKSYKLDNLEKLKPEDLKAYIQAASFNEGPYEFNRLPFDMPKGYNVSSGKTVKDYVEKLINHYKLTNVVATTKDKLTELKEQAKKLEEGKPATTSDNKPTSSNPTDNKPATGLTKVKAMETAVSGSVDPDIFIEKQLSALDSSRFKAYGVDKITLVIARSHRRLEAAVLKNIQLAGDNKVSHSSTHLTYKEVASSLFGVATEQEIDNWNNWFNNRFLPIYLDFQAQFVMRTKKLYDGTNLYLLTPEQAYAIGNTFLNDKYWSVKQNGFATTVNTNPDSIKEHIEYLKKEIQEKPIVEEKAEPAKQKAQAEQQKAYKQETIKSEKEKSDIAKTGEVKKESFNMSYKQDGINKERDEALKLMSDGEVKPSSTVTTKDTQVPGAPKSSGSVGTLKVADGAPKLDMTQKSAFLKVSDESKMNMMNPALVKSLNGAAQEYGEKTGKSLTVTQTARSFEDQQRLYKQNPKKAAAPGKSLHEFGLALDADSKTLNEMDQMGILRKYGLTRPVGSEPWHVEPIGTQFDLDKYKRNPSAAEAAIVAGLGKGGSGVGTLGGSKVYRDRDFSAKIFGASDTTVETPVVDDSGLPTNIKTGVPDLTKEAMNKKPVIEGASEIIAQPKKETFNKSYKQDQIDQDKAEAMKTLADGEVKPPSTGESTADITTAPVPKQDSGIKQSAAPAAQSTPDASVQMPSKQPTGKEEVINTIKAAAKKVGVDENAALATAAVESNFDPKAKAKTSSAAGLFQFIGSTWEAMLKKYGKTYGFVPGQTSPLDANANALMGAHYIKDNSKAIAGSVNSVGPTEAYMAHFLGPGGAKRFFSEMKKDPNVPAAPIMQKAAAANQPIFMNGGQARTFKEIYDLMSKKLKTRADGLGLQLKFSEPGLKAQAGEGKDLAKPATGEGGLGLKMPKAAQTTTTTEGKLPTPTEESKPGATPQFETYASKGPAAFTRSEAKKEKAIETITSSNNVLEQSTVGFSPQQIDTQRKQASQTFEQGIMTATEDLLRQSLDTEKSILSVLQQIQMSINEKNSAASRPNQINNQPNTIQQGMQAIDNTARSATNAVSSVAQTFKATVPMRRSF